MTNYTTHPDTIFDPGKPILGSTQIEARDNLIAAFEGATGAPGLNARAVETVTAGIAVRVEYPGGGDFEFPVMQSGAVRCVAYVVAGDGSAVVTTIARRRAGATTSLLVDTLAVPRTVDVSIQPGDALVFSGGSSTSIRYRIQTAGENLWPGSEYMQIG